MNPKSRREPFVLLASLAICLGASAVGAHDRFTWFLEVAPILIGVPILIATYRRFPLTPLAYRLLFVHAVILMVGGHYTYAEVPLGFWMKDLLRVRAQSLRPDRAFRAGVRAGDPRPRDPRCGRRRCGFAAGSSSSSTCVCLAISACYEFIEWGDAVATGSKADAFLGTQGDPWDTQSDMLWALIGSVTAQLSLGLVHDRQLARLDSSGPEHLPDRLPA